MMENINVDMNADMNAAPLVHKKKKKRVSVWTVLIYAFIVLFTLACLVPIVYEVLLSFASKEDYLQSDFLIFPVHFNFENYKIILLQDRIPIAFLISVFLTVVNLVYSMAIDILAAYVLAQRDLPGRKIFFTFLLIPMFFSGGLVPFYLTLRSLNLTNNLLGLILPFGVGGFNVILLRNFFAQVPNDIIESAKLEGVSDFRVLWQFILPLSKAGIATISLFILVGKWNDWYWPMILLTEDNLFPLALELRNVLNSTRADLIPDGSVDMNVIFAEGRNAAMIIVALLPIMAIYPFLQKYFVKGIMIGAIKS